jgi:hypothetical protein
MQLIRKYPWETYTVTILTYSLFLSGIWPGSQTGFYLKVAVIMLIIIVGMKSLFKKRFLSIEAKIFTLFKLYENKRNIFQLIFLYLLVSLSLIIFFTFLEMLVLITLRGSSHLLSLGLPYSFFSFVINKISLWGLLLDFVIYGLLLKVLFTIKENN